MELTENIMRRVVEGVDRLRGQQRRKEWNKQIKALKDTCSDFRTGCLRLVLESRFADLTWSCKKTIFTKVVSDVRFKDEWKYKDQEMECKCLIQCKSVDKSWKYWISRTVSGCQMRKGVIDIDI